LRIRRLHPAAALLLAATLSGCTPEPEPLPPAPPGRATFDALFGSRQLTGYALSPGGDQLFLSRSGPDGHQLVARSLDDDTERELLPRPAGGAWRLLAVSPRGRDLLLAGGVPGDGCHAPLALRREDGSFLRLTPAGGCATFLGWLREGERLLLASDEGHGGSLGIVELTPGSGSRHLLFANDEGWRPGPLAPDGRQLVLSHPGPEPPASLALLGLTTGTLEPLPLPAQADRLVPQGFAADGSLWLLTETAGRREIVRLDPRTGVVAGLTAPCAVPERLTPSPAGSHLGVDCADGPYRLLVRAAGGEQRWDPVTLPLPRDIELQEIRFSEDDRVAIAAAGSGSWPRDLFRWEPTPGELRQLTYHLGPRVDPRDLVNPVAFAAEAGWRGELFPGRRGAGNQRGVVWIEEAWPGDDRAAPAFHPLVQWLAGYGIPVLRLRAAGSPFGDSPVLPDLDRLATEIRKEAGGLPPAALVGIGRGAAALALAAPPAWRVALALAPAPLREATDTLSAVASAPLFPSPASHGRQLLVGFAPDDWSPAGEARLEPYGAAGVTPGPSDPFGPASETERDRWRAAARALREGARP